jgi:hypothetical protein
VKYAMMNNRRRAGLVRRSTLVGGVHWTGQC